MPDSNPSKAVGHVAGLWRYPVKAMGAEALAAVDVSWHGLTGDRRWAFIRDGVPLSGFPWFTLRERKDLNHYRPSFVDPALPDKSPLVVLTPSGAEYNVAAPALGRELDPRGLRAIKQDRGIFDTFPLSLISTQTISSISDAVGVPLDVLRFRPNILVDATGESPFPEDAWVGRVLCIGGLRMRVDKRDGRCAVITIDPVTSVHNPAILRTVVDSRQGCLGVYGSTMTPGRIALNDPVLIEPLA